MKEYNDGTKTPQNEYVNRPTPLEAWGKVKEYLEYCLEIRDGCEAMMWNSTYDFLKPFIDNVETALKDYQTLKREYDFGVEHYNELLNDYNKEHKVLEIIKEKKVDVYHIQATNKVGEYNFWRLPTSKRLKKEEYDLLKEVLL